MESESLRITAVLVLYGRAPEESECFQSLRDVLAGEPTLAAMLTLHIYDNSPEPHASPSFPATLSYQHDPANNGVAAAYNAGLALARNASSEWLMLLDQDTRLSKEYVAEVHDSVREVPEEVVAIVPRLVQDHHTHSPHKRPRLSHRALSEVIAGILPVGISAFNSGAVLRVSAIQTFPERYWLDFLDHVVFHQLQANGGRIWLMHARLEHRLSTQSLGTEASVERYLNVLLAERDYYRDHGTPGDRIFYHLRRFKQAAGHLLKVRDKRFAWLSAQAAFGLLGPTPSRKAQVLRLSI